MKKNYFGICLMAILSLGMVACSSDDDNNDNVIDVKVKPSGNWIGSTSSTNCELQFITQRINNKDSNMCTFIIEDVDKDTVYALKGGVASFKTPLTSVAFAKTEEGPDSAKLKYVGNALNITFTGGKTKLNTYNLVKNYNSLYTIGGDWQNDSCLAHFIVGSKSSKATISITSKKVTSTYMGTYAYSRNISKGTFVSTDKKTNMTFTLTMDGKTNIPTLTVVNGKYTYKLGRKM
jgi:hypothetical protein